MNFIIRQFTLLTFSYGIYCTLGLISDFNPSTGRLSVSAQSNIIEQPILEPIDGTRNYRINGKKGKDDKPWFDGRDIRHIHCVRMGRCEKLKNNSCFGSKLPYTDTSLDLTDSMTQEESRERLAVYGALRNIPKCWAVIQPFLCAVFAPKCERIGLDQDIVYLPSLEMCRITLEPCRILYNTSFFPEFLKCNETLFPSKCNNDVREMKFNSTGQCMSPLVIAESATNYYKDIDGCGIQCKDPLYTDDEHRQIHKMIAWCAVLCCICNVFVMATFFIDWKNANKYPALIIFYINFCFLVSCLGWLAQFTPGSREDIVCRKDGTLRHSEPSAGENLSCVVVFVMVYYFLVAAMVWFVILTYAWHLRAIGNVQDRIDKKGSYFHLIAWSLPLILTITILALSEVDGNSVVGICFVGYVSHPIRAGLLFGPIVGLVLIGGYFIVRGMATFLDLKRFANGIKSTTASNKIHLIIVRMGLCSMLILVFILASVICQLNEFRYSHLWAQSLSHLIKCKLSTIYENEQYNCKLGHRPSVAILQLQLLCLFGSGIVMSSWCWTRSTWETWKRYFKKKCGREVVEEIKIQKHRVIAQTWAKRKELDRGRLSISIHNTHTDPVGLNFDVNDLNSTGTNDISSTWANYIPKIIKRRDALTGVVPPTNSSSCGPRKSSVDSEISFSVRHVSVESRRNSVDSQVSVKIAEMKTKVATTRHSNTKPTAKSTRNRRRHFYQSNGKRYNRRESSTSVESQVIATMKKTQNGMGFFAAAATNKNHQKRRSGNAGLTDADQISSLLKNGNIIFPFLHNNGLTTTSDDDNIADNNLQSPNESLDVPANNQQSKAIMHGNDEKLNLNENTLKSSREGRTSKSSLRSIRSRKSSRQSGRTKRRNSGKTIGLKKSKQTTTGTISHKDEQSDSFVSSFSSGLDVLAGGLLSSYSGVSLTGKTQSRSSKTSCDVGIQANAFEIATQTMSYDDDDESIHENDETDKFLSKKLNHYSDGTNMPIESHPLLSNRMIGRDSLLRRDTLAMSETEKLKLLLLPSK